MNTVTIPDDCPALKQGFECEPEMRISKAGDWILDCAGNPCLRHQDSDCLDIILIHPDDWQYWKEGDPRPLTMPVGCQRRLFDWDAESQDPKHWDDDDCVPDARRWRKSLNPDLRFEELSEPSKGKKKTESIGSINKKLYYHKTSGGAEYLTDRHVRLPNGGKEGVFRDAGIIVRIDGNLRKDAEITITEAFIKKLRE